MKMTPTKSQQAQEYAKQIQKDFIHNRLVTEELAFEDIEAAWLDGYTAAEQSMWRSVEEELPSNDDKVFVIIHGAYVCGWYDQKYELWEIFGMGSYNRKDASYWMPIPPIPDTNTEKK